MTCPALPVTAILMRRPRRQAQKQKPVQPQPLAIITILLRFPPPFIVEPPAHRPLGAAVKILLRAPAQFRLEPDRVYDMAY